MPGHQEATNKGIATNQGHCYWEQEATSRKKLLVKIVSKNVGKGESGPSFWRDPGETPFSQPGRWVDWSMS